MGARHYEPQIAKLELAKFADQLQNAYKAVLQSNENVRAQIEQKSKRFIPNGMPVEEVQAAKQRILDNLAKAEALLADALRQ